MSKPQRLLFKAAELRLRQSELDLEIQDIERAARIETFKLRQENWFLKYSSNHQQTICDAAVAAACAANDEADLHRALVRWADDLATAKTNLTHAVVARDYALESVDRARTILFVVSSVPAINLRDMDRAYACLRESLGNLEQAQADLLSASNVLEAQEVVPHPLRRD